jgi:hypothetical protein
MLGPLEAEMAGELLSEGAVLGWQAGDLSASGIVETDTEGDHAGFFRLSASHALVRVFETEVPDGYGSDPAELRRARVSR